MKIETAIEQLNKRISEVENHIVYLDHEKKVIDKQVHRKLFKLSGFLLPRISLLLFRQENIEKTYTYVKAYRELLFEELKRVNKIK